MLDESETFASPARIWQLTFLRAGVNESVWDLVKGTPELLSVAIFGPLLPLASLLLGIGLLGVPAFPGWSASLLIVAGMAFVIAQEGV